MRRSIVLTALFFSAFLYAERYVLFTAPGQQVEGYDEIIAKLTANDVVIFSNGAEYPIKKKLGEGGTTAIFRIGGGKAIRLPLKSGDFNRLMSKESELDARERGVPFYPYTNYITSFIEGHKTLSAGGVRVVGMHEHLNEEFVVVDEVVPLFTLHSYLEVRRDLFGDAKRNEIDAALIEWIKSAALFSEVGDFHDEQLWYTDDGWKLLDFTRQVRRSTSQRDKSVFVVSFRDRFLRFWGSHLGPELPADLTERATVATRETRRQKGLPGWSLFHFCGQSMAALSRALKNDRRLIREMKREPAP